MRMMSRIVPSDIGSSPSGERPAARVFLKEERNSVAAHFCNGAAYFPNNETLGGVPCFEVAHPILRVNEERTACALVLALHRGETGFGD